ncbi:MAG: hypothetical protein M1833_001874 [Piccolia ochrophora]|nr:MAG: hypothetical protein M1833_001874 [Piccolia ochrophora]
MAAEEGLVQKVDTYISDLFADWNFITTVLAFILVALVAYPVLTWRDPDTHPMLLARQSQPSPIRNQGESAVYRSLHIPHTYPLRSGLAIKDPEDPRWSLGRDGDLRDIWRRAVQGVVGQDGKPTGQRGRLFTVRGKQEVIEHSLDDVSREINAIGQYLQQKQRRRVAIVLPNCTELLSTVIAAAFYHFTVIVLPCNRSPEMTLRLLKTTTPDVLIAAAGTIPISSLGAAFPALKEVIWIVRDASKHLDFKANLAEKVTASTWHEVVEQQNSANTELPARQADDKASGITTVWLENDEDVKEVVEFSQRNVIAAVAALIHDTHPHHRFNPSDIFLPADSLSSTYPLTLTFAALFSNSSIALNTVAGPGSKLSLAARSISPTVIVASAETMADFHSTITDEPPGFYQRIRQHFHARTLASGSMLDSATVSIGHAAENTPPGKLRLIFISERAGTACPPLSSAALSDIRMATGARVVYALTVAKVAGAVAQTNMFDYRREDGPLDGHSHFGAPLSSVEFLLRDTEKHKTTDDGCPEGEIIARGPAVAGGEASLGVVGTVRPDYTLAYV